MNVQRQAIAQLLTRNSYSEVTASAPDYRSRSITGALRKRGAKAPPLKEE